MKSHDIYFICRNKTSFSKSWTCPSMREDSGYSHLDASTILLHPSHKPSQGGGWDRHGHGSVNPLLQIQNIPAHHVLYLPDKISSQFLKLHNLSLGTWNSIAFIPTHVALSHWHGWRIKLLGCRICAMRTNERLRRRCFLWETAQIKRSSSHTACLFNFPVFTQAVHSGGVMDCLLCSYTAPSILPSHPSVQTRPAVHWRHKQQLEHGSAAETPGRRWLVARVDSGRAVGTGDAELASCRDPPLQSAGAHSIADKGFAKGGMKPMVAAKIIYPKFMSLLLMISPSPVCQRSSECPPFICCKARANMRRVCTSQTASEQHRNCLPPLPSQAGTGNMHALLLLQHFLIQTSPPDPQLMYKAADRVFSLQSHSPWLKSSLR